MGEGCCKNQTARAVAHRFSLASFKIVRVTLFTYSLEDVVKRIMDEGELGSQLECDCR